jgi:hypothetical protein
MKIGFAGAGNLAAATAQAGAADAFCGAVQASLKKIRG